MQNLQLFLNKAITKKDKFIKILFYNLLNNISKYPFVKMFHLKMYLKILKRASMFCNKLN